MIDRIVIATHNPAKRERYVKLLVPFASEVISLSDLGMTEKPAESGETAEDNALIKARFYCKKTELPVLSEDEALYVDFLSESEQPGVHVRRIDRIEEADDNALLEHWEQQLLKVSPERRTGRWHFAYAFAFPDGREATASFDRQIRFYAPTSSVRIPGWPMSSLQGPIDFARPHSEMTDIEKARANSETDNIIRDTIAKLLHHL